MGAAESVPNPDARTLKTMEMANISLKDLATFWRKFRKADKNMTGTIDIDEFYKMLHEKRSIFGDGIFELIDINHSGTLEFGEWFHAVVTYCLFEKDEVLKFCFYIFDRDKNGYIEKEELMIMINVLYHISPPEQVKGNTKTALDKLDFNDDGKIDFEEFTDFNLDFPALFYPAFRVQQSMIVQTMGYKWWDVKKRYLYDEKMRKKMIDELTARKEHNRLLKLRERKVRKKMGMLRYYFCIGQRLQYQKLFPVDEPETGNKLSEAELAALKAKQREIEKRLLELQTKNPETEEWKEYLRRKERKKVYEERKKPTRERTEPGTREQRASRRRRDKVAEAKGAKVPSGPGA